MKGVNVKRDLRFRLSFIPGVVIQETVNYTGRDGIYVLSRMRRRIPLKVWRDAMKAGGTEPSGSLPVWWPRESVEEST